MNKLIKKTGGFTLIELVVAMVIVGVIASLLIIYMMGSTEAFSRLQSRKSLVMNGAITLNKFNREASAAFRVFAATTTNFQFTSTLDTNLVIDYEINNDGTFTRKLGVGSKELVSRNIDFNNSYFNYFDVNDNVATPIRRIRLSLLFSSNNESIRYTADVFPETFRFQ